MKKLLLVALTCSVTSVFAVEEGVMSSFAVAKTIKAGSHTEEENELHRQICSQKGGVDLTDASEIQLSSGATDAVICFYTTTSNEESLGESLASIASVSLSTVAPTGTVPFAPYTIKGTSSYSGGNTGSGLSMTLAVPADNCGVTGAVNIPAPSGNAELQTTCSYPSSTGSHQSSMEAYLEGIYSKSYGTITIK